MTDKDMEKAALEALADAAKALMIVGHSLQTLAAVAEHRLSEESHEEDIEFPDEDYHMPDLQGAGN